MEIGAKVKIINHPTLKGKEGVLFLQLSGKVTVRTDDKLLVVKSNQIEEIKEQKVKSHRPVSSNLKKSLNRYLENGTKGRTLTREEFVNGLFKSMTKTGG